MQPQRQLSKQYNPMHSSQVFLKPNHSYQSQQPAQPSKMSQLYTKATSETGTDHQQYASLAENYQSKIQNLQIGYEKSKSQFQATLKQMYKQKIILLNVIGHNQKMVEEFRNKVKFNPQSGFKELEKKYQIITSGIIHNQLCPECITNISSTHTQGSRTQREIRNPERSQVKSRLKQLNYARQYSWMYVPIEDLQVYIGGLKLENSRLRISIEDLVQQNVKRINEKNRQIDQLKNQIVKVPQNTPSHKIVLAKETSHDTRERSQHRESVRQAQKGKGDLSKETYDGLVTELNQKVVSLQLEKLNNKYKGRYF